MNEVTKIDVIGSSVRRTEDKKFLTGKGRYRGVLSKDVPFASMKDFSGYELVNYSHPKLDVKFERIK